MKDRRGSDRFAVFPFSMGCMSQSAVSVADPSSSSSAAAALAEQPAAAGSSEEGTGAAEAMKVAAGVSRLLKGVRSLSQIFVAYDAGEDEEEEREMVIGYPTDVQHVGHIGWDGHTNKVGADMVNGFSLPSSFSLRHLDMAMDHAAASDGSS